MSEQDQSIGIRVRQRPEHDAVDDAEHRRRQADRDGKGGDSERRERGASTHGAGRGAQILKQRVHPQVWSRVAG